MTPSGRCMRGRSAQGDNLHGGIESFAIDAFAEHAEPAPAGERQWLPAVTD
jgi:hypothetical protein